MDILPPRSNIKRNHPVSLPDATLFPKSIGVLAAGILLMIAWITEKCKIYLPTRHYSQDEMMISIAAAMLGFSIVSLITLIHNLIHHMLHRDLSNKRIPSSQHG